MQITIYQKRYVDPNKEMFSRLLTKGAVLWLERLGYEVRVIGVD
jgi:hypothetical protein